MSNLTKGFCGAVLGLLCVILPAMPVVSAESLWSDTGATANLFSDHRAHAVGDTVTIIIHESSSSNHSSSASNARTSFTKWDPGVGIFSLLAPASAAGADSFKAKGFNINSNAINAKITAQVIDVKSNGDLVISGKQSIQQNGDEQTITVSGVVRVEDVSPNNTVFSSAMSNAKISIDGKGPIARKQRQGVISQLLNGFF